MELIPGDNLEKMLHKLRTAGKQILLNESVQLVRQVALALDYAHKQGMLHRDSRPGPEQFWFGFKMAGEISVFNGLCTKSG
jgi:serine/threonine protein kinase